MKTTFTTKMAALALFTFFLSMLPQINKAQVNSPYTIKNGLSCAVTITWDFFITDPVTGNCVYCNSGGAVTIAAGSSHTLIDADFGSCWPACDLNINVTQIGASTAGLPVTANSTNPTPSLPFVLGCNTTSSSMSWTLFGCKILP